MGFKEVLSVRSFAAYWASILVSRIGDSMYEIALIWLVYEMTGNATLIAVVLFAQMAPRVLVALPAGSLADRLERRTIMIYAQVIRGLAVLSVPLVGHGELLFPVLVAASFVNGVMNGVYDPARQSIVPDLVSDEQLDSANALSNMTGRVAQIFYLAGGVIVAMYDPLILFYFNAATFFVGAFFLGLIPATSDGTMSLPSMATLRDATSNAVGDIREGVTFIRNTDILLMIIVVDLLLSVVFAPLSLVLPVYAEDTLHGGSVIFGLLLGTFVVGRLLSAILINATTEFVGEHRGTIIVSSFVLTGLGMGAVAGASRAPGSSLVVAVIALTLVGTTFGIIQIAGNTLLYKVIPDEKRGMVFSVLMTVGTIVAPVALAAAGPAVDRFGTEPVFMAIGLVVAVVGTWLAWTPLFRYSDSVPASG